MGVDLDNAANLVCESVAQIRSRLPEDARIRRWRGSMFRRRPSRSTRSAGRAPCRRRAGSPTRSSNRRWSSCRGWLRSTSRAAACARSKSSSTRAKLDGLSLASGMVAQRLRAENLNVPAGHFEEDRREGSVRTVGQFPSVEAIRGVIVATAPNGASVRVREVGVVVDGFEEERTLARVNGRFGLAEAGRAGAEVPVRHQRLAHRQSGALRARVGRTGRARPVVRGAMAVLIILFFMLDLRSTIINGIALPTSIVGTFFFIHVLGYTLNMMTLLALSASDCSSTTLWWCARTSLSSSSATRRRCRRRWTAPGRSRWPCSRRPQRWSRCSCRSPSCPAWWGSFSGSSATPSSPPWCCHVRGVHARPDAVGAFLQEAAARAARELRRAQADVPLVLCQPGSNLPGHPRLVLALQAHGWRHPSPACSWPAS